MLPGEVGVRDLPSQLWRGKPTDGDGTGFETRRARALRVRPRSLRARSTLGTWRRWKRSGLLPRRPRFESECSHNLSRTWCNWQHVRLPTSRHGLGSRRPFASSLGMNEGCTAACRPVAKKVVTSSTAHHVAERRDPGIIGIECPLEPDGDQLTRHHGRICDPALCTPPSPGSRGDSQRCSPKIKRHEPVARDEISSTDNRQVAGSNPARPTHRAVAQR